MTVKVVENTNKLCNVLEKTVQAVAKLGASADDFLDYLIKEHGAGGFDMGNGGEYDAIDYHDGLNCQFELGVELANRALKAGGKIVPVGINLDDVKGVDSDMIYCVYFVPPEGKDWEGWVEAEILKASADFLKKFTFGES